MGADGHSGDSVSATDAHDPSTDSSASLLSNYLVLVVATIGGQVLGFLGLAMTARQVGPANLGAYGIAASLAQYFALPLMPGIAVLGIREIAVARRESRGRVAAEIQGLLLANGCLAFAALVALAPVLAPDPLARSLVPIMGLTLIVNAVGLDWALQGLQQVRRVAAYRFAGQVVYFTVLVVVLTDGEEGVKRYAVCNVIGFAVTAGLSAVYVWRRIGLSGLQGRDRPFRSRRRISRILVRAIPVASSIIMVQVYYYSAILMLGYFKGAAAVGQYTTASRLPLAVTTFASLWVTTFYPHAAKMHLKDPDTLRLQVGQFSTLAIVAGLPIPFLAFEFGTDIMVGFFGDAYADGATAFALLMTFAAIALVNANVAQVLLAGGDDRYFLACVSLGAIANVSLNLVLVPALGVTGAAISMVVAEMAVLTAAAARFVRTIGAIELDVRRLAKATLALSCVAGAVTAGGGLPWLVGLSAAVALYAALLLALKVVDVAELRQRL